MITFEINNSIITIYAKDSRGNMKPIIGITSSDNNYRQIAHLLIDKKYNILRDVIANKYNKYQEQIEELEEKKKMCDEVLKEIDKE